MICNFTPQGAKGMQVREIVILSPNRHTNWEDGMTHTIKWRWLAKSKPKKFPNKISIYLQKVNQKSAVKLFTRRAIMGFRPDKTYKTPWYIDKKIYSFPGVYKLKITLDNVVYGESEAFHISKSLHKEVVRLRPKIRNSWHQKRKHQHVNVTVDREGLCADPSMNDYSKLMRVGFNNHYKESGIGGVNYTQCSTVYRGLLVFNLNKIDPKKTILLKAKLHMDRTSPTSCTFHEHEGGKDTLVVTTTCNCMNEVDYIPNVKGAVGFDTPAKFYKKLLRKKQEELNIDVSSLVRKQLVYGAKKLGFKFIGYDERYKANNEECIGYYGNIYLEISLLKRGKLPPPPPPR